MLFQPYLPSPSGAKGVGEALFGLPAQDVIRQGGISPDLHDVALTAPDDLVGDGDTRYLLKGADKL